MKKVAVGYANYDTEQRGFLSLVRGEQHPVVGAAPDFPLGGPNDDLEVTAPGGGGRELGGDDYLITKTDRALVADADVNSYARPAVSVAEQLMAGSFDQTNHVRS